MTVCLGISMGLFEVIECKKSIFWHQCKTEIIFNFYSLFQYAQNKLPCGRLRLDYGYNKGLFLLRSNVVLDYEFE